MTRTDAERRLVADVIAHAERRRVRDCRPECPSCYVGDHTRHPTCGC